MSKYYVPPPFKGKDDQWYVHVKAGNGQIVLQSEGYKTHQAAMKLIHRLLDNAVFIKSGWPKSPVQVA